MKRFLIIFGVVLAVTALIVFNKMTSKSKVVNILTEVKEGSFEISVSASGELLAENSLEIRGPAMNQKRDQRGGGGHGDMRAMDLKIQDIVPEGTLVKAGDYIAQLDRSSYANTLKDELENLTTLQNNMEMKILDTAVALTNLRDDIKNQRYIVEEAEITLAQSKFEPPATIRKAEMSLNKSQRALEQRIKAYELRVAQNLKEINHEKLHLRQGEELVEDLQSFLAQFTNLAPTDGMVIYKKERNGNKRKAGSNVNLFDNIIATLPDLSSMISKIYINEIDISKVKIGQRVNIIVDAFPTNSYNGEIITIANVGEQLPNSDSKLFEVQIKVRESDAALRPSMTTGNKIIIKSFDNVVFIPTECVQTGSDSIPFVYAKNKTKQIVVLGEANDKSIIVEQGLKPGNSIFLIPPMETENFKIAGEELIPIIKERIKQKALANDAYKKGVAKLD